MEREADRVADRVMSMTHPFGSSAAVDVARAAYPDIQRVCADCEDQLYRQPEYEEDIENGELLLTKSMNAASRPSAHPRMETEVKALKSGGELLSDDARAFFEPRFGHDFSRVRVHRDARAERSAASIHARAFTIGNHIVFGAGQYAPNSDSGRRLLAHELTHVRQQHSGRAPNGVTVQRQPGGLGGEPEDPVHDPLIRQFRREQGLPESGIDPDTGERIGPTPARLKYGGLLQAWARSQPGAHFVNATRRCENPAARIAAGQPPGRTVPTINGQVISNLNHVTAQITPASLQSSASGGTTSCRIPTSWRFETSANVITACPAPRGGWTAQFTAARLSQVIGQALPGACQNTGNIQVTLNAQPSNAVFVRRVETSEQEHVADVFTMHDRHLAPYARTALALRGSGNTPQDCQADFVTRLRPHLLQAAYGFTLGWQAAQARLDDPAGTHVDTPVRIVFNQGCTAATLTIAQANAPVAGAMRGNVRRIAPTVMRFNPANLVVDGNDIREGTGGSVIKHFSSTVNAALALRAIQHYGMTTRNVIGPFEYFLVNGTAPRGQFAGVTEFPFDPNRVQVSRGIGGAQNDWIISDIQAIARGININILANFGANRDQAYSAFEILGQHAFNTRCWIGGTRQNPEMLYFRL